MAPRSIEVARPTLDDVFLNLTGRSLREAQEQAVGATDGSTTTDHSNHTEEAA